MQSVRVFLIGLFCLLSLDALHSQVMYGPTVSYQYQKGSTAKVGGMVMTGVGYNGIIRADVTGNMTWTQSKFAVIPEVALAYYFGSTPKFNLFPLLVRAEVTPYTVVPKLGVSLLTVVELDLGYGISIQDKKDYLPIKGFTGSLRFSLPLNF